MVDGFGVLWGSESDLQDANPWSELHGSADDDVPDNEWKA